jgi:mRNA interferase RelE/StbE/toxin YoeB
MKYDLYVPEHLDKIFLKLSKKDKKQLDIIHKKISEILKDPHHYKPLRGDSHGAFRIHIEKSFVLTFEIDEKNKIIRLLDYDHHDKIY